MLFDWRARDADSGATFACKQARRRCASSVVCLLRRNSPVVELGRCRREWKTQLDDVRAVQPFPYFAIWSTTFIVGLRANGLKADELLVMVSSARGCVSRMESYEQIDGPSCACRVIAHLLEAEEMSAIAPGSFSRLTSLSRPSCKRGECLRAWR